MRTIITVLACFFFSLDIASAQPGPNGPPPVFKVASGTTPEKGLILFRETTYRAVPVQVQVEVVENGVKAIKLVTEYRTIAEETVRQIDAASSRIITPDGKQLPIDEVWKRVKANTVVVVSADANAPSAAYLRALSAETVVIIPGIPKK